MMAEIAAAINQIVLAQLPAEYNADGLLNKMEHVVGPRQVQQDCPSPSDKQAWEKRTHQCMNALQVGKTLCQ